MNSASRPARLLCAAALVLLACPDGGGGGGGSSLDECLKDPLKDPLLCVEAAVPSPDATLPDGGGATPTPPCDPQALKKVHDELLNININAADLEPTKPLNATATFTSALPSGQTPSADAQGLQQLLRQQTYSIEYVYRIVGGPGLEFAGAPLQGPVTRQAGSAAGSIAPALLARPKLVPNPNAAGAKLPFDIEVSAVGKAAACAQDVVVKLASVTVSQLPIQLPTVVVAFDFRYRSQDAWGGPEALVFVGHGGVGLVGGDVSASKDNVLRVLDVAIANLNLLRPSFPSLPGGLGPAASFVTEIRDRGPAKLVVTAASRGNLGDFGPSWYNRPSSILMVGAPDGSTTLKLYEDVNQKSHELHLRMPGGSIAASYWTLHESAFKVPDRNTFSSDPVVPDPGVTQDGRADSYPFGSFGNMAKSFQWN